MKRKTLPERIDEALNGKRMSYYDLARALWPDGRSWQYQSNGGPPGCFMALGAALRRGGFEVSFAVGPGNRIVSPRKGAVVVDKRDKVSA